MDYRRVGWTSTLLLVTVLTPHAAQRSRGPLDIRIVGGPAVTLDVPAPVPVAYDAAASALQAANVRFELESAVPDPARPLVDFAHPPEHGEFLTGLTVGDALKSIARAQPRFRWTETDGVIVAGFEGDANSPLDRRLTRFEVTKASLQTTLETLIGQVFIDRDTRPGVVITPRPGAATSASSTPTEKTITLVLDNPTVREVLRAIARQHDALSWTVRYDSDPAGLDRAIITVIDPDRVLVMRGPAVPDPRDATARDRLRLPQNGDLSTPLAVYMHGTRVALGVELLPQPVAQRFLRTVPAINLTGVSTAEAVARIVAHDSRYTVEEREGRFLVRPVPSALARSVLDTPLPEFVRNGDSLEVAVGDLLQRMGAELVRPSTVSSLPGLSREAGEAARQKPVTVALSRPTNVREVLDAICRSLGDVSWFFRYQAATSPGRAGFSLQIESPDRWAVSRGFSIAGFPSPPTRGAVKLPAELDRELLRVVPTGGSAFVSPFFAIAAAAHLPMGVELLPPSRFDNDPRYQRNSPPILPPPTLQPATARISEFLSAMLAVTPEVALRVRDGVINIGPSGAIDRSDHFLNTRLGAFRANDVPAWQAALMLRRRMQGGSAERIADDVTLPAVLDDQIVGALSRRVTVSVDDATPRNVLNAIVREHGDLTWAIAYEPPASAQTAQPNERDSVILLRSARDYGISSLRIARDSRMSVFNTRTPLARRLSTRETLRATLQLPFVEERIDEDIDRLCRALEVRCAIELVSKTPPGWGLMRGPVAANYDFSGLTPAEAFDALIGLSPRLAWRREGDVFRITSAALAKSRDMPLDRRIRNFEGRFESLTALAQGVRELFTIDPAPRRGATPVDVFGMTGGANRITMSPTAGALERPLSLKLRNVSVRQVLDEIGKTHRELSWSVRYIDAHGTYPEFELRLSQPQSATGLTIPVR